MTSDGNPATPIVGAVVVDAAGAQIGSITATAIDPRRKTTQWLIVGLADQVSTALPAFVASVRGDGRVIVPFSSALVADAPAMVSNLVSVELADQLYAHYGLA